MTLEKQKRSFYFSNSVLKLFSSSFTVMALWAFVKLLMQVTGTEAQASRSRGKIRAQGGS